VAGTAGAAIKLASKATRLICPDSITTTGSVASCAVADSATASASAMRHHTGPGIRPAIRSRQPGASTSIPAVASTDSAKPYERASHGSIRSSTRTVPARAASPARRRPVTSTASRITAIMAARSTLGCGRASTTNPTTATNPMTPAARRDRPRPRTTPITTPATIARLAPDTAVRWLSPERRKSSTRSSGIRVVSPTARAGTSPRAAGSRPATACRRSARSPDATDWTADSAEITVGGPRGLSTAAVPSSRLGGASRPVARIRWLGTRAAHGSVAGARISTGSRTRVCPSVRLSSSTLAGTRTIGRLVAGPSRRGCTRAGSPVITSSSVTDCRSRASSRTGPCSMVAIRAAAATATAAPATQTAATVIRVAEPRCHPANTLIPANTAASAVARPAPITGASQPTAHPNALGSTSRRSGRSVHRTHAESASPGPSDKPTAARGLTPGPCSPAPGSAHPRCR